jgi:DNA-binding MarR family transcriptional regulator
MPIDKAGDIVYIHDMREKAADTLLPQMLLDSCMCHRARMAARVVTRAYDDALRPTQLRATQVSVLAAVGARGALSIKSLADTLQMERSTLTRNLRPLEKRGYVELAPERRYRSRVLTLTPAGRAALVAALPLWERAQRKLKGRVGQHRWSTVQDGLAILAREDRRSGS